MTTSQLTINSSILDATKTKSNEHHSNELTEDTKPQHQMQGWNLALIMLGYFLGLASIAVVLVAGQFPWFTAAPATVLLSIAYFRHLDAKYERELSNEN